MAEELSWFVVVLCWTSSGELTLHPKLIGSTVLRSAIRECSRIRRHGLLLTVEFKTVDEYLEKLHRCSEATCWSLGLAYLAAAVSDLYVPYKMATHKIQSCKSSSL